MEDPASTTAFIQPLLSDDESDDLGLVPKPREKASFKQFCQDGSELWGNTAPLALQNFTNYLVGIVLLVFVGRLGEFELGVVVLASSLYNVTGYALLFGMSSSIETLGGAAYGAGKYAACGVILQQALLVNTAVFGLVCGMWGGLGPFLRLLGQDPDLVEATMSYMWGITPAMWSLGMVEALKRYLMIQDCVNPPLLVTVAVATLSPLLCWLCIFRSGWGLGGAAVAFNACCLLLLMLLGAYVVWRDLRMRGSPEQTFHGVSFEMLHGLGTYVRLALPSTVMVIVEWWAFQAVVLMAGTLPDPDASVSIMGVGNSLEEMLYMAPLGLAGATSTRIAQELGGGDSAAAERFAHVGLALTATVQATFAAALFAARSVVGRAFTDAPVVIDGVRQMMLPVALVIFGDGLGVAFSGVLRGTGQPKLGATINVLAHWLIGLPAAAYFGLERGLGWGLQGLWYGICCGVSLQIITQSIAVCTFDYGDLAVAAAKRLASSSKEGEDMVPTKKSSLLAAEMLITHTRVNSPVLHKPAHPPGIIRV